MPEDQRTGIEAALAEVAALLAEKENGRTVSAVDLKEVNAKLDSATQPLAELMMDRVMEQMLEKRGLLPS